MEVSERSQIQTGERRAYQSGGFQVGNVSKKQGDGVSQSKKQKRFRMFSSGGESNCISIGCLDYPWAAVAPNCFVPPLFTSTRAISRFFSFVLEAKWNFPETFFREMSWRGFSE
jgi:hypothetical protein